MPSAVLFAGTVKPAVPGRTFPSGMDVFAAGPLACEAGRRAIGKSTDAATAAAIMHADCGPLPESLHGQAMKLLTVLQGPLPAAAPAIFRTPAWQDKQLGTALAAWAEERHTWALHAKTSLCAFGELGEPPGYVSPYPEFYRGLAEPRVARWRCSPERPRCRLAAAGRQWLAMAAKEGSLVRNAILYRRKKTPDTSGDGGSSGNTSRNTA